MHWDNKVVWSEGMFLRPQHFQQFDRYVEKLVRGRADGLRGHAWGIIDLQINRELLAIGKFAVASCRGIASDGTPFSIPEDVDHPPPLDIPENTRNCLVYLALPARQPGELEIALATQDTNARYAAADFALTDTTVAGSTEEQIQVGKLRMRFALESDERAGQVCLGLARIVEVRADRAVLLDERFIAPSVDCAAQQPLADFLTQLHGILHHRGEELAGRLAGPGLKGAAEVADFLLLQVVNRYEPLLAHFRTDAAALHPQTFYERCVEMAGELSTFMPQRKRPANFPTYRHDDLQRTFAPVIAELQRELSIVIDPSAVPIELQERPYGVRVGIVNDRTLFTNATFVLAVKADMPADLLRRNFPAQAKIGPVEQIKQLVTVALPGIPVQPLPVPPRQLPFYAGAVYFELARGGPLWKQMAMPGGSGGLALFMGDGFPGLEMELWAIKG